MFHTSLLSDLQCHSLRSSSGIKSGSPDSFTRLSPAKPFLSPQYQYLLPDGHDPYEPAHQFINTSENCYFNQVANQNPYLVHESVLKTIRLEFALEDSYKSIRPRKHDQIRVRKRRKPQECDWKPESVYKVYVECKPDFFEKTDYQDRIPSRSCFGKINMRIPRAWSRRPNKSKKRKLTLSSECEPNFDDVKSEHITYEDLAPPPDAGSAMHSNLDDVFSFDFMFGQHAFRAREDISSSSTPIYTL
ncbi:hypothetical protein METSCH_B02210 [Metschnikowia aff. pulcherrima]|uniref:Uncharacterized protein n=1 Tax=Metschnikowia aff. pulcherrima TaxID=2163413 RepID=A0A4P6XIE8_9ASCO|nr:hypothetical protein METSCH_B02210 [Metschnikowia aff. pulcherrima]